VTRRVVGEDELPGRRLTLTPLGLDVIAALAHDCRGIRLTPLATILGVPVSSTQAALRLLMRHGIVTSVREEVPVYQLDGHPARDSLIDVAITTADPAHVTATVLRSSGAVAVALVDEQGFVVGLDPDGLDEDRERLTDSLTRIHAGHPDAPPVEISALDELARLMRVSIGSRARLVRAVVLRGSLERIAASRERVPDGVRSAGR
jgi:hypothetical protein